jgi:ATP-binding cassette, subfamily C, bacterial LapB
MPLLSALARLLSRAAALQGRAIPANRFEFQETVGIGVQTSTLAIDQATRELWLAVFPQGELIAQQSLTEPDEFPALWISASLEHSVAGEQHPENEQAILLVRGRTSTKLLVEEPSGQTREVALGQLGPGELLTLRVGRKPADLSSIIPVGKEVGQARTLFIAALVKRKRIFIEAAFATLLIGIFALAGSLYTMQVYDRVIPLSGFSTLIVLTVGVLIAISLELTIKQVRAIMTERACKGIDYELSDIFFGKAISIRLDARPKSVGTFASQIRHFEFIRNFLTSTTLLVIADIPLALLFIAVIAMIAGPIALIPLVAIPLALLTGFAFRKKLRALNKTQIEESNHKNGLLIEAIDGIESLKASGAEWKIQSRWNDLTKLLAGKELELRLTNTLSTQLSQTVHQLTYVAIIAGGAFAVATGNLTMGGLIACSIIAGRALQPIAQLPSVVAQWQTAAISLEALDKIMEMPDDRPADTQLIVPESCNGAIRVEAIKFQYEAEQLVLDIPALNIKAGERVAIIGAVGCGKSTLLKLLAGLYQPNSGKVFFDNLDMFQLAPEFVREHIGYLPQDIRLFNGTLRENLTLGLPTPTDETILKAATACGLAPAIARHPKGLELTIHEGGRGLSGGQKQLVGLTRMLIARPKVLILDEPTASMDNEIENYVLKHLFEQLPQDTTVITATHKPGLLRYVSRIVVVANGRIALDGPRDEVIQKLQSAQSAQAAKQAPEAVATNKSATITQGKPQE